MRRSRLAPVVVGVIAVALVVLVGYVVLSRAPAVDDSLTRIRAAGVVVVGLDPSYAPFESVDGTGQMAGFDIDLTNEVSRRMGVRAQLVAIDFGSIFDALIARKIDLVVGGVSPDPDQALTVGYSQPYFDDGLVTIITHAVAGSTFGIESGSDADLERDQIQKLVPTITFQQFDDQDQIRSALVAGTLHGAIVDSVTARIWVSQAPGLSIGTSLLSSTPYLYAARRGDRALVVEVDQVLSQMLTDGSIATLTAKWIR